MTTTDRCEGIEAASRRTHNGGGGRQTTHPTECGCLSHCLCCCQLLQPAHPTHMDPHLPLVAACLVSTGLPTTGPRGSTTALPPPHPPTRPRPLCAAALVRTPPRPLSTQQAAPAGLRVEQMPDRRGGDRRRRYDAAWACMRRGTIRVMDDVSQWCVTLWPSASPRHPSPTQCAGRGAHQLHVEVARAEEAA